MKRLATTFVAAAALLVSAAVSMAGAFPPVYTDSTGVSLFAVGGVLTWAVIAIFVLLIVPRRSALLASCGLIAILAGVTVAASQAVTPAPTPTGGFLDSIRPQINDALTVIGGILMAVIADYVRRRWGIEIQAERRNAFQIATTNAAGILARTGDMSRSVEYLKEAAPDAIKGFAIPEEKLPEKIIARAGVIEASAIPVVNVNPGTTG